VLRAAAFRNWPMLKIKGLTGSHRPAPVPLTGALRAIPPASETQGAANLVST
jgi:hypothetical protein